MTIELLAAIHDIAATGDWIAAANKAFEAENSPVRVLTKYEALKALRALEKNLAESGRFIECAVLLWGNTMFDSRPSTVAQVFTAIAETNKLMIMGASSLSKCLGPDVRVMMFDGSTQAAKDVKTGDLLMGDDGKPRNVLAAHSGRGPMYQIIPERGEPWICNGDHLLSLRFSSTKYCGNSGMPSSKRQKGMIKDVSVEDYLELSQSQKCALKLFHVGVKFNEKPLPFDPYIYGAWLGDGCATTPSLHTPEGPMSKKWCEYWNSYPGMKAVNLKQKPGKCAAWRASKNHFKPGPNIFSLFMPTSIKGGEKFILKDYLVNSRANRLQLLAGLLDSDGWLEPPNRNSYGFVARSESLARQVSWLARSLGFASSVNSRVHRIKSIGFSRIYWHTRVSGAGVSEIPCLEKPANEPTGIKVMTNTGFRVKPMGEGNYNGFLIDGNHRFLLGDFTVTHNTYSAGVFFYLEWRHDPFWTAVKLAGPSEDHLHGNLFSHLCGLHGAAVIPMVDDPKEVIVNETDMLIRMKESLPEMGITGVLCKQSQISASGLRGHKPKPYRTPVHHKYANSTRLRILIDEGSQVSPGAFSDIKTSEASIDGLDTVKIVIAFNPEQVDSKVVKMAEPQHGWDIEDVDTLYRYESKLGYQVLRLDGKRFENVVQRKTIFKLMLTYEAYLGFLKAGENSADYWAKGRGFPPLKDNAWTIVPPAWMQSQRGDPIYIGKVRNIAVVDTALGGSDKALFGVGRHGLAAGWTDLKGDIQWFVDRTNPGKRLPHHVAVLDQIFQLPKSSSTVEIAQEVMGRCKEMEIPPENVGMDAGGNASGVYSHMKTFWGDVLGVEFGENASELLVLAEDVHTADKLYKGKWTELWFAMKRWLDPSLCAVLINTMVPTSPLFSQITTRRYHNVKGNKVQVEAKEIYKARNQNVSPDEADIFCLLVEFCRQRCGVIPGMQEEKRQDEKRDDIPVSLENADEPDTLEGPEFEKNTLEDVRAVDDA